MTQTPKQQAASANAFLSCPDLESPERPRYFTGQLLTADELNSEQTYIAVKQRLRNRYLHGPRGRIIAGLQVTKGESTNVVNITAGYAIDYCGNDIVVPATTSFDIVTQIRATASTSAYYRSSVWNPAKTATDAEGQQANLQQQYWFTIAYDEQEVRPVNALRQSVVSSASTNTRKDCGCSNAQSSAVPTPRASSTTVQSNQDASPTLCEPTRIREWYNFDVVAANDATTDLSNARLTGDNRLIVARITILNGNIVNIENDVAGRQVEQIAQPQLAAPQAPPVPPALSNLQNTVAALQDALHALQDEIAQLKSTPTSPAPAASDTTTARETVEPPPDEATKNQAAALEVRPPADEQSQG